MLSSQAIQKLILSMDGKQNEFMNQFNKTSFLTVLVVSGKTLCQSHRARKLLKLQIAT
jgi:hypothetical protein